MTKYFIGSEEHKKHIFPTIVPNWDHSPRSGKEGVVFHNSTPETFGRHVSEVIHAVENKEKEYKLVFLKSWNEWAEGNYMEPDRKWGLSYLETLKKIIKLS